MDRWNVMRISVISLLAVLLFIEACSASKHKNEKHMKNSGKSRRKEANSNHETARKIQWVDEGHRVFRDHDGDIVVSIHDQRKTKKDVRASKRNKEDGTKNMKGKLHWLNENHKIFRDSQGDIVTSIHHQRAAKREEKVSKRTKSPSQKGKGIHWLDSGHKVFKDRQNDIVTSLHHHRAAKKDQRPGKSASGQPTMKEEENKRSNIEPSPIAKLKQEKDVKGNLKGKENLSRESRKLWKKQNIISPNEANKFLGHGDANEISETMLLSLNAVKKTHVQDQNDEINIALTAYKEATKEPWLDNKKDEDETIHLSGSIRPLSEGSANGRISFREPTPYKPLMAMTSEHEIGASRSEAGDTVSEADSKGKESSGKKEEDNSKDGKEKGKDKEKERIDKEMKEKEKEVEKEKEKEKQKELEIDIEKEKERLIDQKLQEERAKNLEKEKELERLRQENAAVEKEEKNVNLNIYQPEKNRNPYAQNLQYQNKQEPNAAPILSIPNVHEANSIPSSLSGLYGDTLRANAQPGGTELNMHLNSGSQNVNRKVQQNQGENQGIRINVHINDGEESGSEQYLAQRYRTKIPANGRNGEILLGKNVIRTNASPKNSQNPNIVNLPMKLNDNSFRNSIEQYAKSYNIQGNSRDWDTLQKNQSSTSTTGDQSSYGNPMNYKTENAMYDQRSTGIDNKDANIFNWAQNDTGFNTGNYNFQQSVLSNPFFNNEAQNTYSNQAYQQVQSPASSRSSVWSYYQNPMISNYYQGLGGGSLFGGNAVSPNYGWPGYSWSLPSMPMNEQSMKKDSFNGYGSQWNGNANMFAGYNSWNGFADQRDKLTPPVTQDFADQYTKSGYFAQRSNLDYPYDNPYQFQSKDPVVQQRQETPTVTPQTIETTQMVNLAQGPHREPPQVFNFPGFKLISETYTDYNENCDCSHETTCKCQARKPTQKATVAPVPPPQAAPVVMSAPPPPPPPPPPPKIVYVQAPPPPPPKRIVKVIRKPAPRPVVQAAPQAAPPVIAAPPPPPPPPAPLVIQAPPQPVVQAPTSACPSPCGQPPPPPQPLQAPPPPPPPPPPPQAPPPPPPPSPPSPPPPPCSGPCPGPNSCLTGACNLPASFTQSDKLSSSLAALGEPVQQLQSAESLDLPFKNPLLAQTFQSVDAESLVNEIGKAQQNPLNMLAYGLSKTDRNGGDLEKLKDRLSDVVADAIVRYKNIKPNVLSKSMLQNANSVYKNFQNRAAFQGGALTLGKQPMGADSKQRQTLVTDANVAKFGNSKGSEKIKINAVWQPLTHNNMLLLKHKPILGLKGHSQVGLTDLSGVKPIGNMNDIHYGRMNKKYGKKYGYEEAGVGLRPLNVYNDNELTDDGLASEGGPVKFKGVNPNGAIYKVRQSSSSKKKPANDDNVYSNYAQLPQEPDYQEGLLPTGEIKEGLSDLLDWSIPPTATAFSGVMSQAQVDGPSLFKLHGAKEREYFSREGEDDQNEFELLSPNQKSAEMFFRDPGRSLPGETLIENSNFDQVKAASHEEASAKRSETGSGHRFENVNSNFEHQLARISHDKARRSKHNDTHRRHHSHHHHHHNHHNHHKHRSHRNRRKKFHMRKNKQFKRTHRQINRHRNGKSNTFAKHSNLQFFKKVKK